MNVSSLFQKALITGATSGIGETLSHFLAKKGISLIITGRNAERLHALKAQLSPLVPITAIVADLANPQQRHQLIVELKEALPDLIINNAGLGYYGPIVDHPFTEQLEMIEVNILALTEITVEASKLLLQHKKQATILNISSIAGFIVFPYLSVYSATKAYVNSFSQALDSELSSKGIRVLCACPGQIDTDFRRRASRGATASKTRMSMSKEEAIDHLWKQLEKKQPLSVFNWKYRMQLLLSRWLPKKLVQSILIKSIKDRLASGH